MSDTSKVTIIHIFDHLTKKDDIVNLIENNAVFLSQHGVEYIVLDNLRGQQESLVLEKIFQVPEYRKRKLEYVKEKGGHDLKQTFLTGARLASHENIFFIFNEINININNVYEIEKAAPLLQKQDLAFFSQNVPDYFHTKNFKLHMKKNKNIIDKIKLMFI